MALAMAKTDRQLSREHTLVVGMGLTGMACVRFLAARGKPFAVADSRTAPPALDSLGREYPGVDYFLGTFDSELFCSVGTLLVSPGLPLDDPAISAARDAGVEVIGDIELFARHADAPVVAITGSNGKSTVTTLVAEMAKQAGRDVRVGGNIGTPALDLLQERAPDLYVLELSSFQLELTRSLNAAAAVVLNISDDHLDRHGSLEHYTALKQRVYHGDGAMIINRDDPRVALMAESSRRLVYFGMQPPLAEGDYGLIRQQNTSYLVRGSERLIAVDEMKLPGAHNHANALAALALGEALGLDRAAMLEALRVFAGLPHRCQWIAEHNQVNFYNDSKGTNVGATLAAIEGMPGEKVVLIAGGEGKGADFSPLREALIRRGRAVVLIGRDAELIAQAWHDTVPLQRAESMENAVRTAAALARPGDSVLLSPACASFDMFANYQQRGEVFAAAVRGLT